MLASSKKKCKPKNDIEFCKRASGKGPKNFKWFYRSDDHHEYCYQIYNYEFPLT